MIKVERVAGEIFIGLHFAEREHHTFCRQRPHMALMALLLTAQTVTADAKGCIKGALVGGAAGHMVGHGKMGAVAGCVVGHHNANKKQQQQQEQQNGSSH